MQGSVGDYSDGNNVRTGGVKKCVFAERFETRTSRQLFDNCFWQFKYRPVLVSFKIMVTSLDFGYYSVFYNGIDLADY